MTTTTVKKYHLKDTNKIKEIIELEWNKIACASEYERKRWKINNNKEIGIIFRGQTHVITQTSKA